MQIGVNYEGYCDQGTTLVTSNYAYPDAGVASRLTGRVYYRLRQGDLDGTVSYSAVRTVSLAWASTPTPPMPP